ncbi:protein TIC 22-like, chloroplastic [Typha angustifolia]|uniref:protein TIC 22-like, chloroplastic n=1 Tax=Typha angustifolia TaxID=59011 RepID=UPI003C2B81D8
MPFTFPWPNPFSQSPPEPKPKSISPNPFLPIQSHLAAFFSHISPSNPNTSSLLTHLDSTVQFITTHAKRALQSGPATTTSSSSARGPAWARAAHVFDLAMSPKSIEERLAGVPVYALSNAAEEFVLVSGVRTGKSLGLFCFNKEDAEKLLEQMRSMNKDMREGSKVVAVALNKIFQLKVDGVAFRFVPDSSQVANAIKEKEKAGYLSDGFSGVPVFQSRSLVLKSLNKRYRPVFFRKEDLEDSLTRASQQQRQLNPSLRKGDIQVCVLEEIIKAMKESSSKWDDVVFIPPGFNVSVDISETVSA